MYSFVRFILKIFVYTIYGISVTGLENIPQNGPAILAANHASMLDPVSLAVMVKRPIHFMGKAELFRKRFLNWLFRGLHAFPVNRGLADRTAIRTALELLADGRLVGIFPEGTRNKTETELLPMQSGASLLAIKAQVPIIPIVVKGTDIIRFRRKLHVIIGKEIIPVAGERATKVELNKMNERIALSLSALNRQDFT